jgi:hypothetical protein
MLKLRLSDHDAERRSAYRKRHGREGQLGQAAATDGEDTHRDESSVNDVEVAAAGV